MDTRKIRKLIELVKETGIGELEVKSGEESVRISCQIPTTPGAIQMVPLDHSQLQQRSAASSTETQHTPSSAAVNEKSGIDGHQVLSPMVGTVYLAPSSGAMPFVAVGDTIKAGDTLCLIEAMKMFNKIEADISGVVSARLIENEQPVEYGQPLFIIEKVE